MHINESEALMLEMYVGENYDLDVIKSLQIKEIIKLPEDRYAVSFDESNLIVLTPRLLVEE